MLPPCFCQNNLQDFIITKIGAHDGLSHNLITSVVSDSVNIKWIATPAGITKYNGDKYTYVRPSKTYSNLKSEDIETLFIDNENNLWIGTKSGGVSMLDVENDNMYCFNDLIYSIGKTGFRVTSIAQDNNNNIWIGTWSNGLFVINPKKGILLKHFTTNERVLKILKDSCGNIWYGSKGAINKYNISENKTLSFPVNDDIVSDIIEDVIRNVIWIGTANTNSTIIYSYNTKNKEFSSLITNVKTNYARSFVLDSQNRLLIGTYGYGLYISDKNIKNFKKINLRNEFWERSKRHYESVSGMHKDKNNVIWVSTDFGGVIKMTEEKGFKNLTDYLEPLHFELEDMNIPAIYYENNTLLFGTAESGIFKLDKFKKLSYFKDVRNEATFKFYANKGKLIVGLDFGFQIYDEKSLARLVDNKSLRKPTSFLIDNKDRLWIGTAEKGVVMVPFEDVKDSTKYKYYDSSKLSNNKIANDHITDILQDEKGCIWISTYNGLHKYNETNKQFLSQTEVLKGELPSLIINCMYFDKGNKWLGTPNGLVKLKDSLNILSIDTIYNTQNGLINNFICSITKGNNDNIWLSTMTEIIKFNKTDESFSNFNESDGIKTTSFKSGSFFNSNNDYIFFGGIDNITFFRPSEIKEDKLNSKIILTSLTINNESVTKVRDSIEGKPNYRSIEYLNNVVLNHKEKSIQVGFSLDDYLGNVNAKYRYRLTNFEDKWVSLNANNILNFTGLKSGNYLLEIQGARNNGQWSPSKKLQLTIKPSPWLTGWAYFVYIILSAIILSIFFKMFYKQLVLKKNLQIAQLEKEKGNNVYEAKLNFFTNVTHEFRTPLTLIISPLTEIIQEKGLDVKLLNRLTLIQKNANRMLNLINQLLDFRKADENELELILQQDNFVHFAKEVYLYFKELAISRNLKYTFKSTQKKILTQFDREKMEMVLCNLLTNAFKNTTTNDIIELKLKIKHENLIIIIKDSGTGIDSKEQKNVFDRYYQIKNTNSANVIGSGIGLAFTKKIVELHNGEISVKSSLDNGAIFTINIPINNDIIETSNYVQNKEEKEFIKAYSLVNRSLAINTKSNNVNLETVLVIEDNEEIRRYLYNLLHIEYNVLLAENGEIGYNLAKQEIPDIIVCDVMMPKKDGLTLCAELKHEVATSHIPIIILTARTATVFEIEGLKTGVDDYITKPFNPELIKIRIKTLLENRKKIREYFQNIVRFEPKVIITEENNLEDIFIEEAILLIEKNLQNQDFGIASLIDNFHMSKSSLFKKIKSLTGMSLSGFIRSVRLKNAARLILENNHSKLSAVSIDVGFNDYRYFKKSFKEHFGCLPSEYRDIIISNDKTIDS